MASKKFLSTPIHIVPFSAKNAPKLSIAMTPTTSSYKPITHIHRL